MLRLDRAVFCNQCCDLTSQFTDIQCEALGGLVGSGTCSAPSVQTACFAASNRPGCRKAMFNLGVRASTHGTSFLTLRPHVTEIVSTAKHRTKDLPGGSGPSFDECRQQYAWLQPSATKNEMGGRMCNTWNRNCTGTGQKGKTSPTLKLVKSTQGNWMEYQAAYRVPCPETTGCVDVGCAA